MAATAKQSGTILKQTVFDFMGDECPRMAAALSYYTVFSLPPLLVLVLTLVGVFVDPQQVQELMNSQVGGLIGPQGAAQIQEIIRSAKRPGGGVTLAAVLGIAALLFGATAAFAQLQDALNAAWEVKPDPDRGDVKIFLLKRVFSFGMIVGVGFLLLVSLVISAALTAVGDMLGRIAPAGVSGVLLQTVNQAVSFLIIALLFAAVFKVVPDAVIAWRDVAVGAAFTALLFVIGKFLIGLYLGNSEPGSAYGAAGSLALILLWIYYSSMILLLGAEFTQVWAEAHGVRIRPAKGAVRVRKEVEGKPA
ncbi:YihY/virulence factor BrkB family protein [soil metagenome]